MIFLCLPKLRRGLIDDALIDSLIDAVHFDDLMLEKDVADVDQIEVFCTYYVKHAEKAKFKEIRKACKLGNI